MSGYQCGACKNVFSEPNWHRELEKIDEGAAFYVVVNTCPDCGSDDLRSVALCIDCTDSGMDVLATDDDYCHPCALLNFDPEQMDGVKRDQVAEVKPLVRT